MGTWLFEPGHTAAMFRARHMMVTYVRGHFKGRVEGPDLRSSDSPPLGSEPHLQICEFFTLLRLSVAEERRSGPKSGQRGVVREWSEWSGQRGVVREWSEWSDHASAYLRPAIPLRVNRDHVTTPSIA